MEEKLSDVLDNILGLLLLEGSYEIEEGEDAWNVSIQTQDAGRLIGARGESLEGLQLLVNQIMSRKGSESEFKRVVLDVEGWRKQKEEELLERAKQWGEQVKETGKDMELEPQSPWQRRVVHLAIDGVDGLTTESVGEGRDRHIIIKLKTQMSNVKSKKVKSKKIITEEE